MDVKNTKPLIGIKSCQELNILTINAVESQKQDNNSMTRYKANSMTIGPIKLMENIRLDYQNMLQNQPFTV